MYFVFTMIIKCMGDYRFFINSPGLFWNCWNNSKLTWNKIKSIIYYHLIKITIQNHNSYKNNIIRQRLHIFYRMILLVVITGYIVFIFVCFVWIAHIILTKHISFLGKLCMKLLFAHTSLLCVFNWQYFDNILYFRVSSRHRCIAYTFIPYPIKYIKQYCNWNH